PELDCRIPTGGGDQWCPRREGHHFDTVGVALEHMQLVSRLEIPQAGRSIPAPGGDLPAVPRDSNSKYLGFIPPQRPYQLSGLEIPDLEGAVEAAGDKRFSVGRKGERIDARRVTCECGDDRARLGPGESGVAVEMPRGDQLPVGRNGGRADAAIVALRPFRS